MLYIHVSSSASATHLSILFDLWHCIYAVGEECEKKKTSNDLDPLCCVRGAACGDHRGWPVHPIRCGRQSIPFGSVSVFVIIIQHRYSICPSIAHKHARGLFVRVVHFCHCVDVAGEVDGSTASIYIAEGENAPTRVASVETLDMVAEVMTERLAKIETRLDAQVSRICTWAIHSAIFHSSSYPSCIAAFHFAAPLTPPAHACDPPRMQRMQPRRQRMSPWQRVWRQQRQAAQQDSTQWRMNLLLRLVSCLQMLEMLCMP